VVLNKADALDPDTRKKALAKLKRAAGKAPYVISGVSGEGVTALLRDAYAQVERQRRVEAGLPADDEDAEEDTPGGWRP
jgi:GTPase